MGEGSGGVVFAEKINTGEEEALYFVRFEHRPAASGDLHRRQAVSDHRRGCEDGSSSSTGELIALGVTQYSFCGFFF